MKKLYLTQKVHKKIMDYLNENFIFSYNKQDRNLTKEELITQAKKNDILITLLSDNIDKDVLSANKNLMGVCNYAVGFNNIDIDFATELNIPITNTPGVLTNTTAELTLALLFSISRRIVEADSFVREGKFEGWKPNLMLGQDLFNKQIGIIGAGRIGKKVGELCSALGMSVKYYSKNNNIENYLNFEEIIKTSDFISIHLPLTNETKHLFNYEIFKKMKKNAILINTARGKIVKEEDLYIALKEKIITAAALDVYEFEPEIHKELVKLPNIIVTPHIGSASIETRIKMGMVTTKNALEISEGKTPSNIINKIIKS